MELCWLPDKIFDLISRLDINKLYNVRLRVNQPVVIDYDFDRFFLGTSGITKTEENCIICDALDIKNIIEKVTYKSLYAFNERIKCGYINADYGIRIGIVGECVFDKDGIVTIKNVSSLNVRIPHNITGCSNDVYKLLGKNLENNLIIVAPPFCGKTTILKDLANKINDNYNKNILIIDERGEFLDISGKNIDIVRYSDKTFAFNIAIRSMSPDVVITDELCTQNDWLCVKSAVNSGVKIIASCHAENFSQLKNKDFFIENIFDRYVFLKNGKTPGVIDYVCRANGEKI